MNEKLLRYLLEQQLLTAEQADELRRAQEETNKSIRELILERAILPEEQVIEALSSLTRTPVVHLYEMTIPMDVRQAVRPDILRTYTMMPFQFDPEDSGTLYVAMNEPMNMKGRDQAILRDDPAKQDGQPHRILRGAVWQCAWFQWLCCAPVQKADSGGRPRHHHG